MTYEFVIRIQKRFEFAKNSNIDGFFNMNRADKNKTSGK